MKVMMSCDNNPLYYQFWNEVSYVWNNIFGIEPVLIYIDDEDNETLNEDNGKIVRINREKDIPVYLQGQLARVYYTSLFQDEVCILSDIDIIPLSKDFFDKKKIENNVEEDSFYHLSPVKREFGQLPMCYYVGHGKTFNNLFPNFTWREFLENVISYDFNVNKLGYILPKHLHGNNLWFSDELFLFTKIREKNSKIRLNNTYIRESQRISREQIMTVKYDSINNYIDCHMPRPYDIYQKQINYIIWNMK